MIRVLQILARALAAICAVAMAGSIVAMAASVFLQVVLRSVFDTTWLPLDDLVVYGFTIVVFTGTALVFRSNTHLATPVLLDALPERLQRAGRWLIDLLCLVFLAMLLVYGVDYALDGMHQFSPLLHVPVGYIYAAIPLSGFAGIVFILDRRLAEFPSRHPPHEDIAK